MRNFAEKVTETNNMGTTITTYLMTDNTDGPKYLFVNHHPLRMTVVPRIDYISLIHNEDLQGAVAYILLGMDELTPFYLAGYTHDISSAIESALKIRFWTTVVVFSLSDSELTDIDAEYLSAVCCRKAGQVGKYHPYKSSVTEVPTLPAHQRAVLDDYFKDCALLLDYDGIELLKDNPPACKFQYSDRHMSIYDHTNGAAVQVVV